VLRQENEKLVAHFFRIYELLGKIEFANVK